MRKIHSLPLFFVSVFTSLLQLHLGTLQSLMRCSLETVQDFLVQVGHKHFFVIYIIYVSFHHQTYQNYQQSRQKLGTSLENKSISKSKNSLIKAGLLDYYLIFKEKIKKDSTDFLH